MARVLGETKNNEFIVYLSETIYEICCCISVLYAVKATDVSDRVAVGIYFLSEYVRRA